MSKISSRNNDFLNIYRDKTSSKIYSILLKLVNEHRENLAKIVVKVDYLLEYSSTCIKQKDFSEAKETLSKVKTRIDELKQHDVDTSHLEYLYEGIKGKCKLK